MYVKAKEGIEEPEYDHPLIEQVLGKTFGLIVFQEDIMNLVNVLGDKITMTDANVLRKLLTKKGLSETKMRKKKDLYDRLSKVVRRKACLSFKQSLCGKRWSTSLAMVFQRTTPFLILSSLISVLGFKLTIKTSGIASFLDHEPDKRKEAGITIARSFGYEVKARHQHIRKTMGSRR